MEHFTNGLPDVSIDLRWTRELFVVGALASLNVRSRRREHTESTKEGGDSFQRALPNPFHLLSEEGSSSSDDDDDNA